MLTHHPGDVRLAKDITILSCPVDEAVRIGLRAADGKNLEVFSPTIGRQLLALGLIDEIDLHVAPTLLGDGIRLYDNRGGDPVRLDLVGDVDPTMAVNLRYRPSMAPGERSSTGTRHLRQICACSPSAGST